MLHKFHPDLDHPPSSFLSPPFLPSWITTKGKLDHNDPAPSLQNLIRHATLCLMSWKTAVCVYVSVWMCVCEMSVFCCFSHSSVWYPSNTHTDTSHHVNTHGHTRNHGAAFRWHATHATHHGQPYWATCSEKGPQKSPNRPEADDYNQNMLNPNRLRYTGHQHWQHDHAPVVTLHPRGMSHLMPPFGEPRSW